MDADRWHRMQEIFQAALDVPDAARAAFVAGACVADEEMARSVRAMLDADAGGAFLDADVASVARDVLDVGGEGELAVTRIGPYRIKSILGEGGSGVVYLAVRDDIGHDVAIKVLRDAWVSSHRRHRFLTEQRTLAKLSHPAIARILDAGILDGGTPWFALELIDGLRLDRVLPPACDGPADADSPAPHHLRCGAACPRTTGRASRPEAVEHSRHRRGTAEAAGLRDRAPTRGAGGRRRPHGAAAGADTGICLARGTSRRAAGRSGRRLLARQDPRRAAHGARGGAWRAFDVGLTLGRRLRAFGDP